MQTLIEILAVIGAASVVAKGAFTLWFWVDSYQSRQQDRRDAAADDAMSDLLNSDPAQRAAKPDYAINAAISIPPTGAGVPLGSPGSQTPRVTAPASLSCGDIAGNY